MERSEPALVPEWLKNAGSLTGGSSVTHSDDHAASKLARKSLANSNGHDLGRSSGSDRTTSSYFRRSSSSNGSGHLRPYSSFGRNQRDRDWEKDTFDSRAKEKSTLGDRRNRDFSDSLKNTLSSKFDRDGLRRSQSMISGKHEDTWHKKVVTDPSNGHGNTSNGLLTKGSPVGSGSKATFERDFPFLGAEERPVAPEVGRVPSPGLSTAIQSLSIGTSGTIGGEKWTSALAEVPVLVGTNGTGLTSVIQATPSPTPVALGTNACLNMAEAVAQGPNRSQSTPQLSVGTQRLEELAIKQSRQLIPVTPAMPKILVRVNLSVENCQTGFLVSTSDKQKTKVGQQQYPVSSLSVSNSPRGGPVKVDVSKTSNVGKLHVLKPVRERNGVIPVVKENVSPTAGIKAASSTLSAAPSVSASAATRGPSNNPALPSTERKPVLTVLEKRPTSQARSRNDFFNLVRKKSMANSSVSDSAVANSSSVLDTGTAMSPSFSNKLAEIEVVTAPNTPQAGDTPLSTSPSRDHLFRDRGELICNGDACDGQNNIRNGKNYPSADPIIPEEEEAAFLRSLGWEENADEGGLTEEEINAFYKDVTKYISSNPSLNSLRVQPKFLLPFDSQVGGVSSGLSSPNAKLES